MTELNYPATQGNISSIIARNDAAELDAIDSPLVVTSPPMAVESLAALHRSWGLPDDRLIR